MQCLGERAAYGLALWAGGHVTAPPLGSVRMLGAVLVRKTNEALFYHFVIGGQASILSPTLSARSIRRSSFSGGASIVASTT